jgi:poly-gamma-glutamate synthesis protein (capsule biosynthesis protein)
MSDAVEVTVVGDVYINRSDPESATQNVSEELNQGDILIGNLEGAISKEGERVPFVAPWHRAHPNAVEGLNSAGFDILSLANNHMMDYGGAALMDTIDRLEDANIAYTGGGSSQQEAESPAIIERNGLSIGVLGVDATPQSANYFSQAQPSSPGVHMMDVSPHYPETHVDHTDVDRLLTSIESAKEKTDILLILFHFGIGATPTVPQKYLAKTAVDAGVDCVLGTNAHVLQGATVYNSTPILYGLSHFFWDPITSQYPNIKPFSKDTMLVRMSLTAAGVERVHLHPARLKNDNPVILSSDAEAFDRISTTLKNLSAREGTDLLEKEDRLEVPI